MGGIILRAMMANRPSFDVARAVMLAPPNTGSELVDRFGRWVPFRVWNGPAGQQLGTRPDGYLAQLGPISFECGIIAGIRNRNPLGNSILGPISDGAVAVNRTRCEGITDFTTIYTGHTFIMNKKPVIQQVIEFLNFGRFTSS